MTNSFRSNFPILSHRSSVKPLIYLDSGATTLKPQCVIDSIVDYYSHHTANIHRGRHGLSEYVSEIYDKSVLDIASFFNSNPEEIIFTSGSTDSINILSAALPDTIHNFLMFDYEHNSLIAPFMNSRCVYLRSGCVDSDISLDYLDRLIDELKIHCFAFSQASHISGHVQDVSKICRHLRSRGVLSIVDASQSAMHNLANVKLLECDFLVASGHKMCGPTGIGILFVKSTLFPYLSQFRCGGGGIQDLSSNGVSFKRPPFNLTSGTPHISGVIGLATAARFLSKFSEQSTSVNHCLSSILARHQFSSDLISVHSSSNNSLPIITLIPTSKTFDSDNIAILASEQMNIMMRSGLHCAHAFFNSIGYRDSLRISASSYNTEADLNVALEFLDSNWF